MLLSRFSRRAASAIVKVKIPTLPPYISIMNTARLASVKLAVTAEVMPTVPKLDTTSYTVSEREIGRSYSISETMMIAIKTNRIPSATITTERNVSVLRWIQIIVLLILIFRLACLIVLLLVYKRT